MTLRYTPPATLFSFYPPRQEALSGRSPEMAGRADVAAHIAALVGDGVLRIGDPGSGWPSLGTLVVDGVPVPVSLFVASVGLSHRERDEVERRFQNQDGTGQSSLTQIGIRSFSPCGRQTLWCAWTAR
jgi:hypothetical protein